MVGEGISENALKKNECILGKQGSLTGIWFKAIQDGKVSLSGTGDHFWPMVHVDDLADAYVKAVERVSD